MSTEEDFEDDESTVTPLTEEQKALVTNNIKLAYFLGHMQFEKMLSGHQTRHRNALTRDEVLQFAQHGLIAAARRYRDYSEKKGYTEDSIRAGDRFSVFARHSIIGAILNAQSREDHVHPLVRARYKKLLAAGYKQNDDLGGPRITMTELALATGMTEDRVIATIQRVEITFISQDEVDEFDVSTSQQLVSQQDVESSVVVSSIQTSLVQTLDDLPTVEQVIVAMRYYYNMKFGDIATELGLPSSEVSSLHKAAVTAIHGSIKAQASQQIAS
jgi:RNA polymerase sigma factor (sigma-70 family)